MPAPTSLDEFLEITIKSGVVEQLKLRAAIDQLRAKNELPDDLTAVAERLIQDGILTDFQAEQLLQGKWKRFTIGKYRVLERIGSGGMGQVFLCEHKLMRRRVAVKVLPTVKGGDPASLERFYREARAVAAVDHPNLVRAYDIDQDDHLHFLVMEYVDGVNLQDLVKKAGPLSPERAAHYIYNACIGLQHAHEMGLVHRDIKPGNILVDRQGVVKILDMGLAKFFNDEEESVTRKYDENILGTADYLSPEQAIDSHTADIRADIYALGGTFYYLLSGKPPFPDGNVTQKLLAHQQREPVPLSHYRSDVPPELVEVITMMMKKNQRERYQKPIDVLQALAPWVQQPIAAPAADELPMLSRAARGSGGPITSRVIAGAQVLAQGQPGSGIAYAQQSLHGSQTIPSHSSATPTSSIVHVPPPNLLDFSEPSAPTAIRQQTKHVAATPKAKVEATLKARRFPSRLMLFIAAAMALVVLVSIAAYFAFAPSAKNAAQGDEALTWYVSKNGTGEHAARTLPTLAAALEKCAPGETIIILDERIEEPPIRISDAGKNAKRGVTIRSGPGQKSVVWAPRYAGTKGSPALEAVYIENLTISGLTFELGGIGECGVAIGFNSPGLTLEQITVKNPRTSGFRLTQLNATATQPARVQHCRVVAGVRCDAGIVVTSGNRFLTIINSRFEGPGEAAIRIDGNVQDVEVKNNRITNFETGVRLGGQLPADANYSLNIAQNTFHTITDGFACEHGLGGAKQQVQLQRNLFVEVKNIISERTVRLPGLRSADNARDQASREAKLNSGAHIIKESLGMLTQADDDTRFLRANGNARGVGPNKVDVGYIPE